MANPVVRPCSACGAPVETKRLTSTPTCGPRCYQRIRRERLEQKSSLDIRIGDMTINIADIPRDIDHDSLRRKILEACGDY
ncbi:hypothetical protein [Pseudomonas syringae]|uniref:hypothetical protein n=1 Tax=Pseudomonas syringae TaxID=317 RepID=UPI0011D0536F|nr:hypothetical protein [Pseudomonas syringae]